MTCPACGEPKTRMVRAWREAWLHRCARCGHGFIAPAPPPAELLGQYQADYFAVHRENRPQLSLVEERRARWLGMHAAPGRLMDVGCGIGLFLDVARRAGWEAQGIEPAQAAAEEARRTLDLPVATGSFALLPEAPTFRAVTLWHVLEHLADPAADLGRVRRCLEAGGVVGIETPAFDSLPARLRGARWEHYRPPEHLQYFTARSLRAMLERAGFTVEIVRRTSFTHLTGPLKALGLVRLRAALVRRARQLAWVKRTAEFAKGMLGLDDCLFAVARRREP